MKTKLTKTEINQLGFYCKEQKRYGTYWGNRKDFEKRHKNIVKFVKTLNSLLDKQYEKPNKRENFNNKMSQMWE